jgi:succinyl-diaminopimelate desuccinylase
MTPVRYLSRHQKELVRFLQQLVRLRTVNPPGENYGEITSLLAETLRDIGLQVRRVPITRAVQKRTQPDLLDHPRYNVIGFWDTGARKTVHFNAHYDVVPVSGKWRHGSPFSGTVEKGWIYGRGSSDMKGAIASIVFALKALRATGTKPNFNCEVSFTADEETDSVLGTGWVTAHGRLKADYALVGEGGEGDGVCCGHNGVVWLNVHVHGRAAHGSTPEEGINALEKMSALVLALDGYKKILARKKFRTPDGLIRTPTLNLGGVFASGEGGKINTVPAAASFSIDRRILPIENVVTAERGQDPAVPDHHRKDLGQPFLLPRSRHALRRRPAAKRREGASSSGAILRFDWVQRHAFLRQRTADPDPRLRPRRTRLPRHRRTRENQGPR